MSEQASNEHLRLVDEGLSEMSVQLNEAEVALTAAFRKIHKVYEGLSDDVNSLLNAALSRHLQPALDRITTEVNPSFGAAMNHLRNSGMVEQDTEATRTAMEALHHYQTAGDEYAAWYAMLIGPINELRPKYKEASDTSQRADFSVGDMTSNISLTGTRTTNIKNAVRQTSQAQKLLADYRGTEQ